MIQSLRKNSEFDNVYKTGKSAADKYFVLYMAENNLDYCRLGISVSKKVGNSVIRHRYKRLIKENFIRLKEKTDIHFDMVMIVRKDAVSLDFKGVGNSLIVLLRKISKRNGYNI